MKPPRLIWTLVLTVGGFLLFRFGMATLYPEAITSAQTANLRQFWFGLTAMQKLAITGMELLFFSGVVLLVVALVRVFAGTNLPR
jgi:hypothetical protein